MGSAIIESNVSSSSEIKAPVFIYIYIYIYIYIIISYVWPFGPARTKKCKMVSVHTLECNWLIETQRSS